MRQPWPRVGALLAALALIATGCGSAPGPARADRLPDVTLASLTGGAPIDLGSLRGPVVVNLWAQWCVPCKRELPIYQRFYALHGTRVPVVGVDWQDTQGDLARAMATKAGVGYPLVVDSAPKIQNKLLPKVILLDADGKIVFQEYVEIKSLAQLEQLVEKHLGLSL